MFTPILATKLYIPNPRPKVVFRPRLIERLNEGLHHKLTLISAPAGFGKTTLVSEWAAGCGRPVAWLSLDEGDSDPNRFLIYLVAALQAAAARQSSIGSIGEGILAVLQSTQPPPAEFIMTALLNEITSIPANFVLVLEDYHLIESRQVDQALTFLLEHLPPQVHLVITTREDPNLPLARLRARSQLTELRADALRFTPSEVAGFLDQIMGLTLTGEDIAALEARSEGWIAGLQLAAISLQGHQDAAGFIKSFTGTHHFVMDYLIEEVLQQQSKDVQTFLLRTSILNRMCGSLCDAVLFDSSAGGQGTPGQETPGQETLAYIERANLFIYPLDNERHWYRYHHLFADLLRQRLGQSQAPEEIAKYHLSASEWYEKNGDLAEAFQHLFAARDFNRAAALAETCWQKVNTSFQSADWLTWVKQLPEALVRSRPVLCTQIAWGYMNASQVDASEDRLRDAERCLEGPAEAMVIVDHEIYKNLPARIAFARAYNAQTQRDFLSTIKYAELAIKLTPDENHYLRAQTAAVLGSTYWTYGDLNAACQSMSDWIDRSLKIGNTFFAIISAPAKAEILTAQGKLREALKTYQQSLQLASANESEFQRVTAKHYLGLALLYHEMGDDPAAAQHLQKSLGLGEQSMSADWPYRRTLAQAWLSEAEGELGTALDLLDEAQRFFVKSLIPYTRPIDALKVRIYLKQGRLSKAEEWVSQHRLSVDDELSYLREFEHITLVRVLLAEYQSNRTERVIREATTLLEHLLKAAEAGQRMGSVLEILVTQVLVHQAQGSQAQAFVSLERALSLAQPEGYTRLFINEGDLMRSLLLDFLVASEKQPRGRKHELTGYVDKLLAAFSRRKDMPPSKLTDPLSPREKDILALIVQGLSNREISERLFLALNTVKGHNQKIFSKLQVQSRTEAIARVRELGLL